MALSQHGTVSMAVWLTLALVWDARLVGLAWGQTPPKKPRVDLTGYWYTRSPKINDVLSTYAGSAYVVMAMHASGEIP